MGIKKRMSLDGHTLTHNEYPQSLRQHYLHQVRGYNLSLSFGQGRHPFVTSGANVKEKAEITKKTCYFFYAWLEGHQKTNFTLNLVFSSTMPCM